jgi:hypothetical protein
VRSSWVLANRSPRDPAGWALPDAGDERPAHRAGTALATTPRIANTADAGDVELDDREVVRLTRGPGHPANRVTEL